MRRGAILEEKEVKELSNKGSEAQQSLHGIEDKESNEALGKKKREYRCDGKRCVRSDRSKETSWAGEKPVIHINDIG